VNRIGTCLWFDTQAEEAASFYVSIFKNSRIKQVTRWPAGAPQAGQVLTVSFEIDGREFLGLNGGPQFKFSEAISLIVNCETQEEIDHYWAKLTEGGQESQCGWLKDKFGLSWQVVPVALGRLLGNPATAPRVMGELMKMVKLDLATLERAAKE